MSEAADILLRGIARKIQLNATLYDLAVERYGTIYDYLRRDSSPLRNSVARMYPQGSMMIGSSVSSKVDTDEFDIDLVLELDLPLDAKPRWVLDAVYDAIRGEYGSRYHSMTDRQTRCVTVDYAEMHLDITPAILLPGRTERTGNIFHSRKQEPEWLDKTIIANPWGFGDWFIKRTPLEAHLREAVFAKTAEPVKEQQDVEDKSLALISLQLVKRWRNLKYDSRDGRKPPSVLLAKLIADAATGRNSSLLAELTHQVESLITQFQIPTALGRTIYVDNPACPGDDIFTDRWPEDLAAQKRFLGDLLELKRDLQELAAAPLNRKAEILMRLFGETAARTVVREFTESLGRRAQQGGLMHSTSTGAVAFGASGIGGPYVKTIAPTQKAPGHSFYGDGGRGPGER